MLDLMIQLEDFPIDTSFSQVSIVKNPTKVGTNDVYQENTFSGLNSVKFSNISGTPKVGEKIEQVVQNNTGRAYGYVASYDLKLKFLSISLIDHFILQSNNS